MFQQNTLGKADFPAKMTGAAVVQPASSDKWKEPYSVTVVIYYKTLRHNMFYFPGLQSIIFLNFFCN